MGKGNIRALGKFEGCFYLDMDLLALYRKPELCPHCGEVIGTLDDEPAMTVRELMAAGIEYDSCIGEIGWVYDDMGSQLAWNDMVSIVVEALHMKYSSFAKVSKWRGKDIQVVLENERFQIAVADNEWSAAWLLLERDDIDDTAALSKRKRVPGYLEALKNVLLNYYGECCAQAKGPAGAWTHGETYTKELAA